MLPVVAGMNLTWCRLKNSILVVPPTLLGIIHWQTEVLIVMTI